MEATKDGIETGMLRSQYIRGVNRTQKLAARSVQQEKNKTQILQDFISLFIITALSYGSKPLGQTDTFQIYGDEEEKQLLGQNHDQIQE